MSQVHLPLLWVILVDVKIVGGYFILADESTRKIKLFRIIVQAKHTVIVQTIERASHRLVDPSGVVVALCPTPPRRTMSDMKA